jgi:hypothetical protein
VRCWEVANEKQQRPPAKHFRLMLEPRNSWTRLCSGCLQLLLLHASNAIQRPPTPSPSAMPNSGRGAPPDLTSAEDPHGPQTWSLESLMPSDLRIRASSASPFAQRQNQQPYINVSGGGSDSQTPVNGPEAAGKKGPAGSVSSEAWWDW